MPKMKGADFVGNGENAGLCGVVNEDCTTSSQSPAVWACECPQSYGFYYIA